MTDLIINFEWESPEGARGPELRATWARLQILAGGEVVTRVEDQAARSVRDAIYLPLYPLAEWIAANWWPLLYEVASPHRLANGYSRRHDLTAASEGFAVPPLRVQPEGQRVLVAWEPLDIVECRLRFLGRGALHLQRESVEDVLRSFVVSVLARLEDEGVSSTHLEEEWRSVEGSDSEERDFCRAAGQLGHDPFAITEPEARIIVQVAERLPGGVADEFFAATNLDSLDQQARALTSFIRLAAGSDLELAPLQALRKRGLRLDATRAPWEQGYDAARKLRDHLGFDGQRITSVSRLGDALSLDAGEWKLASDHTRQGLRFLDAMVATTRRGGALFAVKKGHKNSRAFAACRALFEYLTSKGDPAAVVAPTFSERQKRNRAFAAELLAPANRLRESLSAEIVSEEEIDDLAQQLDVSSYVVRHQIENHDLAQIVG